MVYVSLRPPNGARSFPFVYYASVILPARHSLYFVNCHTAVVTLLLPWLLRDSLSTVINIGMRCRPCRMSQLSTVNTVQDLKM